MPANQSAQSPRGQRVETISKCIHLVLRNFSPIVQLYSIVESRMILPHNWLSHNFEDFIRKFATLFLINLHWALPKNKFTSLLLHLTYFTMYASHSAFNFSAELSMLRCIISNSPARERCALRKWFTVHFSTARA